MYGDNTTATTFNNSFINKFLSRFEKCLSNQTMVCSNILLLKASLTFVFTNRVQWHITTNKKHIVLDSNPI